jgi:cyclopropane fatty-acyl-phospholipid synthase-like methyltransferase
VKAQEDRALVALRGPFTGSAEHRDAPYWQTPEALVEAMLDLASVGPGDRLIDLGCGDGRIVIAAATRGALALGIEIDPARIAEAKAAAAAAGVPATARFRREDLFETRLEDATVVALYLLPHVNAMLCARLRGELRPGSRVVGHAFPMPDWAPAAQARVDKRQLYLWVVPER